MDAIETGKKWGESVTGLARTRFLSWADGRQSFSDFDRAMFEAERDLPESCDAFRVDDLWSVDAAWIKDFCEGVRSARTKAEGH
jgi:hypothetical protein